MAETRDLKLEYLVHLQLLSPPPLKTAALNDIAEAFVRNTRQVKALSLFPLLAVRVAAQNDRVEGGALMRVVGDVEPIPDDHPRSEEVRAVWRELWSRILENDRAKRSEQAFSEAAEGLRNSMRSVQRISGFDPVVDGIDAWFSAQIVGGWTAFETMAADLWEAALNCHPHGLSDLKGRKSSAPIDGRQDVKSIPLAIFQKYKDLSKAMGTILRERRGFDNLENIRNAYAEAFYESADDIEKFLGNESIDALNAVRNLIVHRASIVDQKYINRTRSLTATPKADIGKPILLDGEIVGLLVQPVLELGCKLIIAVDHWLAIH